MSARFFRRLGLGVCFLGLGLGGQAAWAEQAPAEPAFCPPEECGDPSCWSDAECGGPLVCLGVSDPCPNGECDAEPSPGVCRLPPDVCSYDWECGTEQVCYRPSGPPEDQPPPTCGCGGGGAVDDDCDCPDLGPGGGACRNREELLREDPCALTVCGWGYECAVVSPTCAPGEPCPTVEPGPECVPSGRPIECHTLDECPTGWACQLGTAPDEAEQRDPCNPEECGEGAAPGPAPEPASVGLCVPPEEERQEEGDESVFDRDGFVNGGGEGSGGSKEGCAVAQVGPRGGPVWGLGALLAGLVALARRRR